MGVLTTIPFYHFFIYKYDNLLHSINLAKKKIWNWKEKHKESSSSSVSFFFQSLVIFIFINVFIFVNYESEGGCRYYISM